MENMAQGALRLVPWETWQLWNEVRKAVFSSSPNHVVAALNKISAWRARSSLPVAVEVTWDLISIQSTDPYFLRRFCVENSFSDELLRLMYAMAIMRLINGIVDHSKKHSSLSVADRAEAAGLPRMLVDIRHEVAHQELPSLSYLRLASKEALNWLKVHYWEAQKRALDNAHKHLEGKLQAYASRYDVSKNGAMFNGGRKRSVAARAKKLVELSAPTINLLDKSTSDKTIPHDIKEEEVEHGKRKDFFLSDDTVDAEFEKSRCELSRAIRRLRLVCRSHQLTKDDLETDIEEIDSDLHTSCDFVDDDNENIESGAMKSHSLLKEGWSVPDNWKPCAIGLLPSKSHRGGVLPFSANLLSGVVEEPTARSAETNSLSQKATESLNALNNEVNGNKIEEIRDCLESKGSDIDIARKRLKMDTEAKLLTGNEKDKVCRSCHPASANDKEGKILPEATPISGKHKGSLLLGGLLLVEGVYQRCGIDSLAAMRSSIQIL